LRPWWQVDFFVIFYVFHQHKLTTYAFYHILHLPTPRKASRNTRPSSGERKRGGPDKAKARPGKYRNSGCNQGRRKLHERGAGGGGRLAMTGKGSGTGFKRLSREEKDMMYYNLLFGLVVDGVVQWWTRDKDEAIAAAKKAAFDGKAAQVVNGYFVVLAEYPARIKRGQRLHFFKAA
jgi:hypothetical protein